MKLKKHFLLTAILVLIVSIIEAKELDSLNHIIDSLKIKIENQERESKYLMSNIDTLKVGYYPINSESTLENSNSTNYSNIIVLIAAIISAFFTFYGVFWQTRVKQKKEFVELLSEYLEFIENESSINREIDNLKEKAIIAEESEIKEIDKEIIKYNEKLINIRQNKSNEYKIFTQLKPNKEIDKKIKAILDDFSFLIVDEQKSKKAIEKISVLIEKKYNLFNGKL